MKQFIENKLLTPKDVLAVYLPTLGGGGAERVMVQIVNEFAERGGVAHLVVCNLTGPNQSEVNGNVKVTDLGQRRVLFSFFKLCKFLRDHKPNVLLSALSHANLVAVLAALVTPCETRVVVSERSMPSRINSLKFRLIIVPLMRAFYRLADRIICVSESVAQDLISLIGVSDTQIDVIPNPIDKDAITAATKKPVIHRWLSDPNKKFILAVGRLVPDKDYPTLFKAVDIVRREIDVGLYILGEGDSRLELNELISEMDLADHVEMAGFDPNPFNWMSACDLYVLSSTSEGFCNSLLQAVLCGAPVVSTDCGSGVREILACTDSSKIVPIRSPEMLAEAIIVCLKNEHIARSNPQLDQYDIKKIASSYYDAIGF